MPTLRLRRNVRVTVNGKSATGQVSKGARTLVEHIAWSLVSETAIGPVSEVFIIKYFQTILKRDKYINEFKKQLIKVFNTHLSLGRGSSGEPWIAKSSRGVQRRKKHKELLQAVGKRKGRYGSLPAATMSTRLPFEIDVAKRELEELKVSVPLKAKDGASFRISFKPKAIHPQMEFPASTGKKHTKSFVNTIYAMSHSQFIPAKRVTPTRARSLISVKNRQPMLAIDLVLFDEELAKKIPMTLVKKGPKKGADGQPAILLARSIKTGGFTTTNTSFHAPYFTLNAAETRETVLQTFKKIRAFA